MNEAFCNASYMAKQTTFYTTTHTSWLKEVFVFVFALSLYLSLCLNKCFSFCLNIHIGIGTCICLAPFSLYFTQFLT